MENNKGYIEFLKSESHKNQIDTWYKSYNIVYEKTQLYRDFFISLLDLIDSTYLGKDVLKENDDIKKHFLWCFNEIVSNFEKEKIYFKRDGMYVDYLWIFFYQTFYLNENEDKIKRIRAYLYNIFIFNYTKTKTDLEMLTEFYTILNQNLKR
jgi:hypothetical protein